MGVGVPILKHFRVRVVTHCEGGKLENGQVVSPEVVSIYLNQIGFTLQLALICLKIFSPATVNSRYLDFGYLE